MRTDDVREGLIELGADVLAAALVQLAGQTELADSMVKRLLASPSDNLKRFRTRLSGWGRRRGFVTRAGAAAVAADVRDALDALRAGVADRAAPEDLRCSSW